jgi:hypothetical protein
MRSEVEEGEYEEWKLREQERKERGSGRSKAAAG